MKAHVYIYSPVGFFEVNVGQVTNDDSGVFDAINKAFRIIIDCEKAPYDIKFHEAQIMVIRIDKRKRIFPRMLNFYPGSGIDFCNRMML